MQYLRVHNGNADLSLKLNPDFARKPQNQEQIQRAFENQEWQVIGAMIVSPQQLQNVQNCLE